MLMLLQNEMSWVIGIALASVFILTFWRGKWSYWSSVALYSLGTLGSIGMRVYEWGLAAAMIHGLSEGGAHSGVLLGLLLLSIVATGYAIGSAVMLLPAIRPEKAMRWGKVLHLGLLPLLLSVLIAIELMRSQGRVSQQLPWLIYGLLWFRIRESHESSSMS